MNIDELFVKEISGVLVYPGSLDELNNMELSLSSGKRYELIPVRDEEKFLVGTFIPSVETRDEYGRLLTDHFDSVEKIGEFEAGLSIVGKLTVDGLITQIHELPFALSADLRVKAKRIGADGLIHFQPYFKELYMAVPVKLVQK